MLRKVRHIVRQAIVFLLLSLFLVTTSGFKLYSHFCSHEGISSYSLMLPVEQCECAATEKESCCTAPVEDKHDSCDDACCSDIQLFSILELDSLQLSQTNFIPSVVSLSCLFVVFTKINTSFLVEIASLERIPYEVPPPLPTLKYLSTIQVYLI